MMWLMSSPSKASIELKTIRKKLKMTQAQMGEALGFKDRGTYKNYEYTQSPTPAMLQTARRMADGLRPLSAIPTGPIEVLGAIGANTKGPDSEPDADEMQVPIAFAREDYKGVPVPAGEFSMVPYIHPGDTLIFKKGSKMDKFVAVRLDGETLPVCKKLTVSKGKPIFKSMGKGYAEIDASNHQVLGYLVGIVSADMTLIIGPDDRGYNEASIREAIGSRLPQADEPD